MYLAAVLRGTSQCEQRLCFFSGGRPCLKKADATEAKVCKSLHDEQKRGAKYFKEGKIHKYSVKDTLSVEHHHKDVLTRHRQQSW